MVDEKTRYNDEELQEFKEIINEKLAKAKEELTLYKGQLAERAENQDSKLKGLDDGLGSSETERISNLASRQEKYIKHLQNALIRIQNKVYGICRESGKLIPKERLKVVPHATLSVQAKNSRKRKGR